MRNPSADSTRARTARKKRLGALLAAARRKAGLTQATLARQIGVTPAFIGKVERGDGRLDVIVFLKTAQILEVDPAVIVAALRAPSGDGSATAHRWEMDEDDAI